MKIAEPDLVSGRHRVTDTRMRERYYVRKTSGEEVRERGRARRRIPYGYNRGRKGFYFC